MTQKPRATRAKLSFGIHLNLRRGRLVAINFLHHCKNMNIQSEENYHCAPFRRGESAAQFGESGRVRHVRASPPAAPEPRNSIKLSSAPSCALSSRPENATCLIINSLRSEPRTTLGLDSQKLRVVYARREAAKEEGDFIKRNA